MTKQTITFINSPAEIGGPGTFQKNFTEYCESKGVKVYVSAEKHIPDNIVVISGTRKLIYLLKSKILYNAKIIHRLDGFEFLNANEYGFKKSLHNKLQFLIIIFIMLFLSDEIIFQSEFVYHWWKKRLGITLKPHHHIIHNGFHTRFSKNNNRDLKGDLRLVCVEGAIQLDALRLKYLKAMDGALAKYDKKTHLNIYGKLAKPLTYSFGHIRFCGALPRDQIRNLYSEGKVLFIMLERNAACPNSLIEAIGSGVPSVGFNDGSHAELAQSTGVQIDIEDIRDLEMENLEKLLISMLINFDNNYDNFFIQTIERAHDLTLDKMCERYFKVVFN